MQRNSTTSVYNLFYKQCFKSLKNILSALSTYAFKFSMSKVYGSHLHKQEMATKNWSVPKKVSNLVFFFQELHIKALFPLMRLRG